MRDLAQEIARARPRLEPAWDDARAQSVLAGLPARRRRRQATRAAAAVVLALVALAGGRWLPLRDDGPPALRFADGSRAEPLGAGSAVEPRGPAGAEVLRGGARFHVTHDTSRVFRVRAGAVTVEVLGTEFTVERLADAVEVAVQHGHVRAHAGAVVRDLTDGQRARFAPPPRTAPPTTPTGDDVTALLQRADQARLAHRPADAVAPLEQALLHPADPRAPLAAFSLGRVALELGRPRAAAAAFARTRALAPDGPLADDALARQAESLAQAGDHAAAAALARQYLARHPDGDHARALRRLAAP